MSKHEKLLNKFLARPRNFTYDDLVSLLRGFGYTVETRGRSSGSAVMFYNARLNDKILIHMPHPEKEIKRYVIEMVIEKLRNNQMI